MKDLLGNEVNIGDIIVHYNNLYIVKGISPKETSATLFLKDPSPTTRNKVGYYTEIINVTSLIKEQSCKKFRTICSIF